MYLKEDYVNSQNYILYVTRHDIKMQLSPRTHYEKELFKATYKKNDSTVSRDKLQLKT